MKNSKIKNQKDNLVVNHSGSIDAFAVLGEEDKLLLSFGCSVDGTSSMKVKSKLTMCVDDARSLYKVLGSILTDMGALHVE